MTKLLTLLTTCLLINGLAYAQVKIGDNAGSIHPFSLLELESTSKGLLIPRLTIGQIDAMINPPDAMTVYNTTNSVLQIRSAGSWKTISTDASPGTWNVTGNAAISSSNFIGSTNNASVRFRTNNLQRMIIDSIGKVTIGTDLSNVAGEGDGFLHINNTTSVNTLNIKNTSNNTSQYGLKAVVNGVAAGSSRIGADILVNGAGNVNIGVYANVADGSVAYGGRFNAGGALGGNVGISANATGNPGTVNYAVQGTCFNGWAGFFTGNLYTSNRTVLGANQSPENAQLTVRTPDTSYNAIFATTANTGGNGVLSTYTGAPNIYYAFWGIAPASNQNAAGYFSGNVTVTGTFTNPSDERLKENLQPVAGALDKVMQLGVHSYNFKPEYNHMNLSQGKQFGYLAQNLESVFPELVETSVDKTNGLDDLLYYKSVNYIGMIPVLTKALPGRTSAKINYRS